MSNSARPFDLSLPRQASTASVTAVWPSASNDAVGSSNTKQAGSDSKALAKPIRCLCPPDSLQPFGPTLYCTPPSSVETKLQFAVFIASITCSCVASGQLYLTLFNILVSNSAGF
mmetsp:Transcript_16509/g.29812  ORF Transcript_16509/g.29812 Transcript_16509/m.29812 type:complete len:115 (+) Transcript_16509:185-529(+)